MPWSVIGRQTVWGHQLRWAALGNISVNPNDPRGSRDRVGGPGDAEPERHDRVHRRDPGDPPNYDPCGAGPGSDTDVFMVAVPGRWGHVVRSNRSYDGTRGQQWFPWADHKSDGTLAVAWDEDDSRPVAAPVKTRSTTCSGTTGASRRSELPSISTCR